MEIRYLNNLPKEGALAMVVAAVEKLTMDHGLNIRYGFFLQIFGRELTLEEFLVMMIIEKDVLLRMHDIS